MKYLLTVNHVFVTAEIGNGKVVLARGYRRGIPRNHAEALAYAAREIAQFGAFIPKRVTGLTSAGDELVVHVSAARNA